MRPPVPTEMSCRELVELVTAWHEGALPMADRTRFEMHLCLCAGCRGYLQQMRRTIEVTGSLTEEDLAPAARKDLLRAFRQFARSKGEPR